MPKTDVLPRRDAPLAPAGDLDGSNLPDVLRALYRSRFRGALRLTSDDDEKIRLQLAEGAVLAASSSRAGTRLGDVLADLGLLSRAAIEGQIAACPELSAGQALRAGGLITDTDLRLAVETQIRQVLLPAFGWAGGSYELEHELQLVDEAAVSELSMAQLIVEGVRGSEALAGIAAGLIGLDAALRPTTDPHLAFQSLTLAPEEGFLLSRIDGRTTLAEVIRMSPLDEDDTAQRICVLLLVGLIELAEDVAGDPGATVPMPSPGKDSGVYRRTPTPPSEIDALYARLETLDHFELLGVDRTASAEDVDQAFLELAVRFHPDVGRRPSEKEKLGAILARLAEAAHMVRDPGRRRGYVELLARDAEVTGAFRVPPLPLERDAELELPHAPDGPAFAADASGDADADAIADAVAAGPCAAAPAATPAALAEARERHARAERLLEQDRYWDAICELRRASELDPEEVGHLLLLARVLARQPKWDRAVEKVLFAVLRRSPDEVEAHLILASVYRRAGLAERARRLCQRALELEPDNTAALAAAGGLVASVVRQLGERLRRLLGHRS